MIKEVNKKYLNEIVKLHYKSIVPMWLKLGRERDKKGIIDYMNYTFKNGKVFGYFLNDKLVGCIGIVADKKFKYAEVEHVLVDEKYQKRGIGREMMEFIEDYAKKNLKIKIKELRLTVLCKNPAVTFYEKMGYTKKSYTMIKKV